MASASDSTHAPSRRAFFAHAAASGFAATLPPIITVTAPSALAIACDAAVARLDWISASSRADDWPDERLEDELVRIDDVMARVAAEPSVGPADLRAKARLILANDEEHLAGSDSVQDRAVLALLREVAALAV